MRHSIPFFTAAPLVAVLLAGSALSGCGVKVTQMYVGEKLPPDKVAIIEPMDVMKCLQGHGIRTYIAAIDGQKLGKGAAEVLPGRHTVATAAALFMGYEITTFVPEKPFTFDAQAGHTYRVMGHFFVEPAPIFAIFSDSEETPPTIWIEDKESKEVVAGEKPPQ